MLAVRGRRKALPYEDPQVSGTVAPGDLLALLEGSAEVADRQLVDPGSRGGQHPGRYLGLQPKAVLFEVEAPQQVAAECLVPRRDVADGGVVHDTRRQAEQPISDVVREEVHALRLTAAEPRAVDSVGVAGRYGLDQTGNVDRVVLEISVLHDDDIPTGEPQGRAYRSCLALVLG